jgi:hypothetical protein
MDLEKDTDWQFICDCEKIRDGLLHANGRIDLSEDKADLEKIVSRSKGWLAVNLERIVLTGEFLEKVRDVLNDFIEKIESKAPA